MKGKETVAAQSGRQVVYIKEVVRRIAPICRRCSRNCASPGRMSSLQGECPGRLRKNGNHKSCKGSEDIVLTGELPLKGFWAESVF